MIFTRISSPSFGEYPESPLILVERFAPVRGRYELHSPDGVLSANSNERLPNDVPLTIVEAAILWRDKQLMIHGFVPPVRRLPSPTIFMITQDARVTIIPVARVQDTVTVDAHVTASIAASIVVLHAPDAIGAVVPSRVLFASYIERVYVPPVTPPSFISLQTLENPHSASPTNVGATF